MVCLVLNIDRSLWTTTWEGASN